MKMLLVRPRYIDGRTLRKWVPKMGIEFAWLRVRYSAMNLQEH
jgi:hypothetical protein